MCDTYSHATFLNKKFFFLTDLQIRKTRLKIIEIYFSNGSFFYAFRFAWPLLFSLEASKSKSMYSLVHRITSTLQCTRSLAWACRWRWWWLQPPRSPSFPAWTLCTAKKIQESFSSNVRKKSYMTKRNFFKIGNVRTMLNRLRGTICVFWLKG